MSSKVSDSYLVRKADLVGEREDILRLWSYLPRNDPPRTEKLDWFYLRNPAGRGIAYLLIYIPEDRPVGVMLAGRRKFCAKGTSYDAAVFGDFAIEPAHRSLGPGLMFQRYVTEQAVELFDLTYGFPGKRSGRLRQFGGYQVEDELHVMVLPMKPGRVLRRHLAEWLAVPARYVISLSLRIFLATRTVLTRRQYRKTEVDEAFINQLWQSVKQDQRMIGVRDWSFVHWRILSDPFNQHSLYGVRDKNGNAVGYLAYKTSEGGKISVVDYLTTCNRSFSGLFAHFVRDGFDSTTTSISVKISKKDKENYGTIRKYAFWRRDTKKLFVSGSRQLESAFDSRSIFISPIDNDV